MTPGEHLERLDVAVDRSCRERGIGGGGELGVIVDDALPCSVCPYGYGLLLLNTTSFIRPASQWPIRDVPDLSLCKPIVLPA
ncbi:hypothetical protein [Frondihabitans sp. VKM Ac-2883]|uniref:hypothetical protein n=1 Tax=Frondihabitans sp. VKM Ac-2883 TaxID=2783823 RepID=UPI00188CFC06|nr:hypothetical protein [Frondihabitans sp. VKM Ac-2883]MBF4575347.1 hypothetical protein [Frondihabitans sp. VKM Ac-2883]